MTHHHARLVAVAIAAVSFSAPLYAQQEPTPSPTWETLLETFGGTGMHERSVWLSNLTDTDLALLVPFTEWGALEELRLLDDFTADSEVTGAGLAHLTGLTALEELGLGGTQVTDAGLAHLAGLTALEELYLRGTQVTDAGLAHLTGLTALEILDLGGTQVTDAGLANLTGLPSLQRLVLYDTDVTAAGLVHFQKMPSLSRLELSGYFSSDLFTEADIANLREALPNVQIEDGTPVAAIPPPPPSPPPPR